MGRWVGRWVGKGGRGSFVFGLRVSTIGRSASAKQPARWSGMHHRAMSEPVVARSGPVGGHEGLQAGWIRLWERRVRM